MARIVSTYDNSARACARAHVCVCVCVAHTCACMCERACVCECMGYICMSVHMPEHSKRGCVDVRIRVKIDRSNKLIIFIPV